MVCPYGQFRALWPAIKTHIVRAHPEQDMKVRQEIEAKRAAAFAKVKKKRTQLGTVKMGPLRVVRGRWQMCS